MTNDQVFEMRHIDAYDGAKCEVRIEQEAGKPPHLRGYAARFNILSNDLGGFRERIMPGAFSSAMQSGVDVRALVDHDKSKLLGRTSAGTLKLGQDDRGLWFDIEMPDVQYARDLQVLVKRGDYRGMSFGFLTPKNGDRFVREGAAAIRELLAVDLKEITVTSIPAYPDTSLYLRVDPALALRLPGLLTPNRDAAARKLAAMKR